MYRSRIFRTCFGGLFAIAVALGTSAAHAVDFGSKDGTQLVVGGGIFNVLHQEKDGLFGAELRLGGTGLWILTPFVGAEATTAGSTYTYAGLGVDIYLDDSWVLNPNAAAGAWTHGGGKNLGATVEFRTGAELDYRFSDMSRIGVSFHHISNAGIGKHNPGEEEAMAVYSLPLSLP